MTIATFGGWRAFVYQITFGLSEKVVHYYYLFLFLLLFFCVVMNLIACGSKISLGFCAVGVLGGIVCGVYF